MKVIIVGAGIGGLSTAVALKKVGIESVVIEKSKALSLDGAGITFWNNGLQALSRLGLRTGWQRILEPLQTIRIMNSTGKTLGRIPVSSLGNDFGPGAGVVHRPDLTTMLAEHLPNTSILLGAECSGFRRSGQGIEVSLTDGRRIEGDRLIGADGIRSQLKKPELSYVGHTAWRGRIDSPSDLLPAGESIIVVGRGAYFTCHHMTRGRYYWLGTRKTSTPTNVPRDRWKTEILAAFEGWRGPIQKILEATPDEALLVNDIFCHEKADYRLGSADAALVGDAAHASTPQLGQGACVALEDAVVLADLLRRDPNSGLETFTMRELSELSP